MKTLIFLSTFIFLSQSAFAQNFGAEFDLDHLNIIQLSGEEKSSRVFQINYPNFNTHGPIEEDKKNVDCAILSVDRTYFLNTEQLNQFKDAIAVEVGDGILLDGGDRRFTHEIEGKIKVNNTNRHQVLTFKLPSTRVTGAYLTGFSVRSKDTSKSLGEVMSEIFDHHGEKNRVSLIFLRACQI